MSRGNASLRRTGVYGGGRFDPLLPPTGGAIQQDVGGTLTMAGAVAGAPNHSISLDGTLTMASILDAALLTISALVGTLTASATLSTTYTPPAADDSLTTLLRRNQTD